MPPKKQSEAPPLKDCKIMGVPITMKQEEWEIDETEEQITVMCISKLLKSKSNMVQKIMLNAKMDAKRMLNLKIIFNAGTQGLPDIKVERPHHEYAIAHYLYKPSSKRAQGGKYNNNVSFMQRHKHDCSTCRDPQTSGPFMECITYNDEKDGTNLKGACLNCYYTGTSSECSLRKKAELDKKNKEMRTMEKIKEEISIATINEANMWLPILKHELGTHAERKANKFLAMRPDKE